MTHITPAIARTDTGEAHGPRWFKFLCHLQSQPCRGGEVGSFKGNSAEWFLENICAHADSHFHCIDTFKGGLDHHAHGVDCTNLFSAFKDRVLRFDEKCRVHIGPSHIQLYGLQMGVPNFDFFYIDGDHHSRGTLRDAVLVFDLLKVGGIMIFDDYTWTAMPTPWERPKMAIDAFLDCYALQLEVLERSSQVVVRKIAQ